jgi:2-haloacid dehalogenase
MSLPAFVFDAYGTLFDVNAAIARHRAEVGAEADRLAELWRGKQLEYTWTLTLAGEYVPFWTLTQRALDFALQRIASVDRSVRSKLLDAYFELGAYPDAATALRELKRRGHATAILSNGSPEMLEAAIGAAGLRPELDLVLSVDSIRLYKPRREVYAMVPNAMNASAHDVVFVSSNRWDVMGAALFGFRPVWINRSGMPDEYPDGRPEKVVTSLADLLTLAV